MLVVLPQRKSLVDDLGQTHETHKAVMIRTYGAPAADGDMLLAAEPTSPREAEHPTHLATLRRRGTPVKWLAAVQRCTRLSIDINISIYLQ